MRKKTQFPPGWNEERVRRALDHYEQQPEVAAVADDEAAHEDSEQVFMEIPVDLVPAIRRLLAKRKAS